MDIAKNHTDLCERLHEIVAQIIQGRHGPTNMQLLNAIAALRDAAIVGSPIPAHRVEELQKLLENSMPGSA